jgi:hypothetical protein
MVAFLGIGKREIKQAPETGAGAGGGSAAVAPSGPQSNSKPGLDIAAQQGGSVTSLPAVRRQIDIQKDASEGYAHYFEKRPEWFHDVNLMVYDASPHVRERTVEGLKIVAISSVFSGKNETFIGFGKPNLYTVTPDGKGGYQKFAVKSFWRQPSTIDDTRGFVQSAPLVRLKNLPAEAQTAIRDAMKALEGKKFRTCVNGNCTMLEMAGFHAGKTPLSSHYRPVSLARTLSEEGLFWKGQRVEIDVVRTPSDDLELHGLGIRKAEAMTFYRHGKKAVDPWLEKSGVGKVLGAIFSAPSRMLYAITGKAPVEAKVVHKAVAPALPANVAYKSDMELFVSRPTKVGALLRLWWGPHTLFELRQSRVDIDQYLPRELKAFPQENPSFFTKLKRDVLFSRPVVGFIHSRLANSYERIGHVSEADVYRMLRTHSEGAPNKYNLVILREPDGASRIVVSRLHVGRDSAADWILTKHVLLANYGKGQDGKTPNSVRYGSEGFKTEIGEIAANKDSGTFRPTDKEHEGAVKFLQAVFPNLNVVKG